MAVFNYAHDYFSTLDRGYYNRESMDAAAEKGFSTSFPEEQKQVTELTALEIGTTMAPDTHPVRELQAKIREGAAKLEVSFAGAGKSGFGGRGATPEVIGTEERRAFRELAKLNKVKVSTHATFGKQGLSGLTQQGFSDDEVQKTLKEINKAIDFAAEATTGGAVVFHTGEWQRPIMDAGLKDPDKVSEKERMFKEYDTEYKKTQMYLADAESGQIIALNREMKFYFPDEKKDPKSGMTFVEFNDDGTPKVKEYDFKSALNYIKKRHDGDKELEGKSEAEILLYGLREQQLKEARGTALRYSENLGEMKKALEQVQEKRKLQEEIWDKTPESERWKLMEMERNRFIGSTGEYKPLKDTLKEQEDELRKQIEGFQSTAVSAQEQYEKVRHEQQRFKPIDQVGVDRSASTIAKAGIRAMEATKRMEEFNKDDTKNLEPIYIAPENLFPDFYGSHPAELATLVTKSRDKMAKQLMEQRHMSEEQAKEVAQTHIKATFDTGHMNLWRQHFQRKEGEGDKDFDNRFKKWFVKETKELVDKKIIGHIHLTDNYGYDDEHLTPGQGNTPTKELVKIFEDAGIKDFIVEVGSFNAQTILPDTLALLGSPMYALSSGGRKTNFSQFRQGHFGYAGPANYIAGAYAPSNEWRLWSEIPLE